jgi:uncharacterized protein YacL
MNIYLEIFGYIGSIMLMISMMMTSMVKLRIINIIGSIISTIYAIIHGAYAVVFLNVGISSINIFHLIRALRATMAAKSKRAAEKTADNTARHSEHVEETI